jgi:hypothetical protein
MGFTSVENKHTVYNTYKDFINIPISGRRKVLPPFYFDRRTCTPNQTNMCAAYIVCTNKIHIFVCMLNRFSEKKRLKGKKNARCHNRMQIPLIFVSGRTCSTSERRHGLGRDLVLPALHNSNDDGVFSTSTIHVCISRSWNCQKLATEQLLPGQAIRTALQTFHYSTNHRFIRPHLQPS